MEEKKPRIKILVACHKADPNIRQDDIYMPIQVGKALHPELDLGFQCDNTGDNISEKNGSYCELTALYWAWKNLKDVDYIGLCHYRRYFNLKKSNSAVLSTQSISESNDGDYLIKHELINRNTVILPSFTNLPYDVRTDFQNTVLAEDIYILYKIIEKYSPEYLSSFKRYLMGNKRTGFNMFIMHFEEFSRYAGWLFFILSKVENSVTLNSYISYKRLFGYLGEFLLPIYCIHNKLNIKQRQIQFVTPNNMPYRGKGIASVRYGLNEIAFKLGKLGRKQNFTNNYWDLYLKLDNINI